MFAIDDVVESIFEVVCIRDVGIVGAGRFLGSFECCNVEVVVCGGPKIESKKSKSGKDVVDVIFDVIGITKSCRFTSSSNKSA